MIEVADVSVAYGDAAVLDGASLAVAPGEFVGLVGPNGAGKTTLLKAINGVVEPDAGTVLIDGESVHGLSSRAASRLVATVPQDTTVAFDFAVEDVVAMGRTPYHGRFSSDPGAAEAVDRALERTETAQFRDRSVGSLSGGERQRVLLARALAQETPALLLDEPTAELDINHQVRTLDLVRGLVDERGTAALAAIHDLDLAARFCDRIAVLAGGDVLAVGPPGDVLTSDRLRAAFDTDAAVRTNPVTGTPSVTPVTEPPDRDADVVAHVAGSGPVAARTIAALREAGVRVTAGPIPRDGVAAATAAALDVDATTVPPFEPIDAATEAAVRDDLAEADVGVLAGRPAPSVRALLREADSLVRVVGQEGLRREEAKSDEDAPSADERTTLARVGDAVRALAADAAPADDD